MPPKTTANRTRPLLHSIESRTRLLHVSGGRLSSITAAVAMSGALLISCVESDRGPATQQGQAHLDETRQEYIQSDNGLRVVNGLQTNNGIKATNGLKSFNGLSLTNGLRSLNGLTTINGIKTYNGLTTVNGVKTTNGVQTPATLNVDCTGRTLASLGGTCTGEPDGLLSRTRGMMSSDAGIETAKYLVRCALPAGKTVTIKDYTGALISMPGGIGIAPTWETGQCDRNCEERVSACLIALTNGEGNHVAVELTSPLSQIGTNHSMSGTNILYPYQEAVTYGNLFLDPPQGYIVGGVSYPKNDIFKRSCNTENGWHCVTLNIWNGTSSTSTVSCSIGPYTYCPYSWSGTVATKCTQTAMFDPGDGGGPRGTATACEGWKNPLTVYRAVPPAN